MGILQAHKSGILNPVLQHQEGGDHYSCMKIQPIEYIHANQLSFAVGCIIKYVSRYQTKGGKEDLMKARHFIDLLITLEYPDGEDI